MTLKKNPKRFAFYKFFCFAWPAKKTRCVNESRTFVIFGSYKHLLIRMLSTLIKKQDHKSRPRLQTKQIKECTRKHHEKRKRYEIDSEIPGAIAVLLLGFQPSTEEQLFERLMDLWDPPGTVKRKNIRHSHLKKVPDPKRSWDRWDLGAGRW